MMDAYIVVACIAIVTVLGIGCAYLDGRKMDSLAQPKEKTQKARAAVWFDVTRNYNRETALSKIEILIKHLTARAGVKITIDDGVKTVFLVAVEAQRAFAVQLNNAGGLEALNAEERIKAVKVLQALREQTKKAAEDAERSFGAQIRRDTNLFKRLAVYFGAHNYSIKFITLKAFRRSIIPTRRIVSVSGFAVLAAVVVVNAFTPFSFSTLRGYLLPENDTVAFSPTYTPTPSSTPNLVPSPKPAKTTSPPTNTPVSTPALLMVKYDVKNGQIFRNDFNDGDCIAPLDVSVPVRSKEIYLVSIKQIISGKMLSFFILPGKRVEIDVPLGTYEFYYACGENWYGNTSKFGGKASYFKSDDTLRFSQDEDYIYGHTLELWEQYNGNFETDEMKESEFPW